MEKTENFSKNFQKIENIQNFQKIEEFSPKNSQKMLQIFVKFNNKTEVIEISNEKTVEFLKNQILDKFQIQNQKENLIFRSNSNIFIGNSTLYENNVENLSNVFLHFKLRGGMMKSTKGTEKSSEEEDSSSEEKSKKVRTRSKSGKFKKVPQKSKQPTKSQQLILEKSDENEPT
jgi:hypothetical protein